jgi:hypothetical protein
MENVGIFPYICVLSIIKVRTVQFLRVWINNLALYQEGGNRHIKTRTRHKVASSI